jgi:hypothetical protein
LAVQKLKLKVEFFRSADVWVCWLEPGVDFYWLQQVIKITQPFLLKLSGTYHMRAPATFLQTVRQKYHFNYVVTPKIQ